MTLQERIDELVAAHGSLREVARLIDMDAAYLSRLRSGLMAAPSQVTLAKLGLRRKTSYERTRGSK
jgi:transcriptional regulator with XRE-family HTH domain